MGVPGFFKWLLVKYKNKQFIKNKYETNCDFDSLLIDANCLLHPQCFKILNENPHLNNHDILEYKMINQCIIYLNEVINYIDPNKEVFIAIDGVAPIAKMKQQRQRRYKSVNDKILFDNIKKKHDKEITTYWNNSAITPGTKFMKKLTNRIISYCKELKEKKKIKIIFSTAETPAEGEHKLLQHIRNSNNDYKYVVYGLDADLIFLSLSANKDNIYLMRESNEINKNNKEIFNLVDIDILKNCIIEQVSDIMSKNDLEKDKIIRDFIFICYFLGNDFLPHMEALDISKGGIDILLKCYCAMYKELYLNGKKPYIVLKNKICKKNLLKFINLLYVDEKEILKLNYNTKRYYPKCDSNDSYVREMHRIDNVMFKVNDPIMVGKDDYNDYRKRYYMYHMNIEEKDLEKTVEDICMKYLQGLEWVTIYYFKGCPDWHWYYPYDYPPFLNDIKKYIKKYKLTKFNLNSPLKPYQQLLCVLPIQSKYLVPYKYRYYMHPKSKLGHLYPYRFKQDFIGKTKYWKGIPILPKLDIESVLNI